MSSHEATPGLVATDGRVIGERATATRRRLLDATLELLKRDGPMELKVVDVTREAGAAPATFYQYFADLDAAILALADDALDDEGPLASLLLEPWRSADDWPRVLQFVDAYAAYWDRHQVILMARTMRADAGDIIFRGARARADLMVIRRMADLVSISQNEGRLPSYLDPFATAAGMRAMAERLFIFEPSLRRRGTSREGLRNTLAAILFRTLSGVDPPADL